MSRSMTGSVEAALEDGNVRWLLLIDLEFDGGTVRVCNAAYNFAWNGNTYLGCAAVGSVSPINEDAELSAQGIELTLSGVNPANIAIALGQHYQGRPATIRLALLDAGFQIIADPVVIGVYRMDQMPIEVGASAVVRLTAESRFADWDRPRVRRFNHEDQIAEFPTDRFFEFVPQMAEKQLFWGIPGGF